MSPEGTIVPGELKVEKKSSLKIIQNDTNIAYELLNFWIEIDFFIFAWAKPRQGSPLFNLIAVV